jgi:hypothetical protein
VTNTKKLSDTQLILLTSASQRENGSLLPPPSSITARGEALRKSISAIINRGLVEEKEVTRADAVWSMADDRRVGVFITDLARTLLDGSDAEEAFTVETTGAAVAPAAPKDLKAAPRSGTKQALVVEMLQRESGVALAELAAATGWLPHTTRAALTGLKKKGHAITKAKTDGVSRYSLTRA